MVYFLKTIEVVCPIHIKGAIDMKHVCCYTYTFFLT